MSQGAREVERWRERESDGKQEKRGSRRASKWVNCGITECVAGK